MLHSPAIPALQIQGPLVNLSLDMSHELLWEEGGWLGDHFENEFSFWCVSSCKF